MFVSIGTMFKEHIAYLNDNPKGYWFKRKLYGWGWTPARWQGWVILGIFLAYFLLCVALLPSEEEMTKGELSGFLFRTAIAVLLLIVVCYKKGEKPKWQWGIPKK